MAHSVALMMALTLSLGRIKSLSLPKAVIAYGFCLLGLVFILGSRQQGILFVLVIALCFSLVITKPLFLRLLVCLSLVGGAWVINGQIAQGLDKGDMPDGSRVGLTIAMRYDLAGILANGGELNSDNTTLLNELGNDATMYSPSRVDTLTGPASQVWSLPFSDFKQIWWGAVTANPGAYIKHRLSHYLEL
ncbi:MAG: hypothetical protein OIF35_02795, partial [Cellvibrionaceae bacterium]|nr:hypothetical protein [Cellvibrionaceae bacterium]